MIAIMTLCYDDRRTHKINRPQDAGYCYRWSSVVGLCVCVCVCVSVLVTFVRHAQTAEPIEMPFGD